jgi:hypothetical protein
VRAAFSLIRIVAASPVVAAEWDCHPNNRSGFLID